MRKKISHLEIFCDKFTVGLRKEKCTMTENKQTIPENTWKCSNCGNTIVVINPPEICPSCQQKCAFLNVTCYEPDCGFTGMDKRLKPRV
jgi:rubredoxin